MPRWHSAQHRGTGGTRPSSNGSRETAGARPLFPADQPFFADCARDSNAVKVASRRPSAASLFNCWLWHNVHRCELHQCPRPPRLGACASSQEATHMSGEKFKVGKKRKYGLQGGGAKK